jgi:phage host-nuclease inhibitor protein Gam
MAKALKTKAPATPAAQTREQAEAMVHRIGEIQRELVRRDADLGDSMARIKKAAEEASIPLKDELRGRQEAVQAWAEANRVVITRQGRTKTVELATGKVSWRQRPPSVKLRGVEAVIQYLLARPSLSRFLRVKHEIDKETLAREPEFARSIPGVTIGSAGEDFIIEPFEAPISEVRS